ncbi:MAG: hypothetical protein ACI81P_003680 [Neolewinella sp.]|jgi:hypothetical protein
MTNFFRLFLFIGIVSLISSCEGDDDGMILPTQFKVTIENVSTPQTVATDRAMGTVPLRPPTWAVYATGDDPMFITGKKANLGTARIAEDGFPDEMLAILGADSNVKSFAAQTSPGGPDNGPAVFAGESVTFSINAVPGDKLQFGTMFVQSNDWFYAFSGNGVELFNGNTPLSGDLTSRVNVYDAGTEQDTAPGAGPDQKPVQEAMVTNVGPDEDENIARASDRHNFTIPATSAVIKVTITPAN